MINQNCKSQHIFKSFLSGGLGGIIGKSIIAPIDRIKMLYITRDIQFSYQNAVNDAVFIYKKHGFLNFWRGNAATLMRFFPYAINFSVFDFMRETFYLPKAHKRNIVANSFILFACGSCSGIISTSICYPVDVLWTRMVMQKDNFMFSNLYDALKQTATQCGVHTLFDGLKIALFGIVLYHGMSFFIFTKLKEYYIHQMPTHAKQWYGDLIFGSISGVISQIICYPIDILRKRVQAQQLLLLKKEINYKQEGLIRGFYKGITLNILKTPICQGVAWTFKNKIHRLLDDSYDF